MLWSILLVKKNDNGWFINYIQDKLNLQISKLNLHNNIEVIIYEHGSKFHGDYVNIIEDNVDISDNYIESIYNKLSVTDKDCIVLKGLIFIDKYPYESYLPITKYLPIKKEIIFNLKNILYYINSENLYNVIKTNYLLDEIVIFKEEKSSIKEPISIIVTAYETQDYIEECLDSIEKQSYFINNEDFEVLVGVDGCKKTLDKLMSIQYKYRNLTVYMMKENKGTYITTNTLINLAKYENIIRFDSDDIMTPNLIREVFRDKKDNGIVVLGSFGFMNNQVEQKLLLTEGIIYFKKSIMDNIAGGYQPWICSADTELIKRVINKVKVSQIKKALFYRRIHNKSLTQRKDTKYNSEIRENYKKLIKKTYRDNEIKIERIVNDFIKIKKAIHEISIIITAYNTKNYIEDCLDSIENQTYFIDNEKFEVLVGIDNCSETLEELKKIKHKYRNLRVFMMDSNKGTYVTSNTLIDLTKYTNIIRFDSDDIMKPEMVEIISDYINKFDVIKFGYDNFYDTVNNIEPSRFHFPHGVVLYKKEIFDKFGGYQNWQCAADTEFLVRINKHVKITEISKRLFLRRQHNESLTRKFDTQYGSALRNNYKELIGKHKSDCIEKITNTYIEY